MLALNHLTVTPPYALIEEPFSSVMVGSQQAISSRTSDTIVDSYVITVPSTSVVSDVLRGHSSTDVYLAPLFSFSFAVFRGHSFSNFRCDIIFYRNRSFSVGVVRGGEAKVLYVVSYC